MGSKALGCFGGCDLHGKPHDVYWTHLNNTADIGDTTIVLQKAVDWEDGSEVVITTTGYRYRSAGHRRSRHIQDNKHVFVVVCQNSDRVREKQSGEPSNYGCCYNFVSDLLTLVSFFHGASCLPKLASFVNYRPFPRGGTLSIVLALIPFLENF